MILVEGHSGQEDVISRLFLRSFTASEGAAEGQLIGDLAADLMATTPKADLFCFRAVEADRLTGCIIFSRMAFDQDSAKVFLLSPVAVDPGHQGQGIGQRLITFGLDRLRKQGVDVAVTYGDPGFYARVGFRRISESLIQPPHPLTQPEGWLGQSLSDADLRPLAGPCRCVAAMDRPDIW